MQPRSITAGTKVKVPGAVMPQTMTLSLVLSNFSASDTHKQVHHQQITLTAEYKSIPTCFGYCP